MPPTATAAAGREGRFARFALAAFAALVLGLACGPARAQTWTEVGDAGDLPGTAQFTVGTGPLTQILGTIPSPSDVDMYCVNIASWPTFNACLLCVVMADEDIWLFDGAGKGVAAAQICQGGCKLLTNAFVPGNGLYYLVVSAHGVLPYAGANPLWLPGTTLQRAPDGPGAGGTVTSWAGAGTLPTLVHYTVNLAGTAYCNAVTSNKSHSWGSVRSIYR
jgi:hypothetical protein